MAASATVEEVSVQVPKRPEATTNEAANTPNFGSLIPPTDLMSVSVLSWRLVRSARAHPQETECDLAGPPDACRLRPARQMKGCGPKRPSSGRCSKPRRTHEPAGSS